MKNTSFLLIFLIFILFFQAEAQISTGINNPSPSTKAALHINTDGNFKQGIIVPALNAADTLIMSPAATDLGLFFYDKGNDRFMYFDGSKWRAWQGAMINSPASGYWDLSGNKNTGPLNFIGTSDNHDLRFRTNNLNRMVIDSLSGYVGIGNNNPAAKLEIGDGIAPGASIILNNGNVQGIHSITFENNGAFKASVGYSNVLNQDWFFIYNGGNVFRSKGGNTVIGNGAATFAATLENTGSMGVNVITITGDRTISNTDYIILSRSATSSTITLPTDQSTKGRIIYIKNFAPVKIVIVSPLQIVPYNSGTPLPNIFLSALSSTDDEDDCFLVFDGINWVVLE